MDNYLLLQKNNSIFLFVHYPDRYHIISVNKQFTDEKEEKLLSEACSDAVIDEMSLTRTTILKKDLRGVAIGGCEAGAVLVLHAKDGYYDLATLLSQMGFQYGTYLWDPAYKGLDDYVWQCCYRRKNR